MSFKISSNTHLKYEQNRLKLDFKSKNCNTFFTKTLTLIQKYIKSQIYQ